jgi:hypothetical protein
MKNQPDRDKDYMYSMWGTNKLATDYGSLEAEPITLEGSHYSHGVGFHKERMLREIVEDDITPKKHNFIVQNEIHEKIRNDEDYDDWSYGTEPLPLKEWK